MAVIGEKVNCLSPIFASVLTDTNANVIQSNQLNESDSFAPPMRLAENMGSSIYGLIYTRKCGWLDLGHANADGPDGAKNLWDRILNEKDEGGGKSGFFRITYKQMMGNRYIKIGTQKKYDIKKGICEDNKKSVALAIFLDVSDTFESMQSSWPFKWVTNSGYS